MDCVLFGDREKSQVLTISLLKAIEKRKKKQKREMSVIGLRSSPTSVYLYSNTYTLIPTYTCTYTCNYFKKFKSGFGIEGLLIECSTLVCYNRSNQNSKQIHETNGRSCFSPRRPMCE